jgi:prevent-host-death family protein
LPDPPAAAAILPVAEPTPSIANQPASLNIGQLSRNSGGVAMTETVNLYDAKTNLSELVDRAAAGEEIVIAKAGKPKAKLVPYQPPRKKRRFGQNLLGITYIAEDFDAPLPPELQKYFE